MTKQWTFDVLKGEGTITLTEGRLSRLVVVQADNKRFEVEAVQDQWGTWFFLGMESEENSVLMAIPSESGTRSFWMGMSEAFKAIAEFEHPMIEPDFVETKES